MGRREALEAAASCSYPWDAAGLSRAARVITFLEDLEITTGRQAGTKLHLRQWQRKFVEAVYREDKRGIRPIRTAVLSMARLTWSLFNRNDAFRCQLAQSPRLSIM